MERNISKAKLASIKRRNRTIMIIGLGCAVIQLILTVVFIVMLHRLDILTLEYKVLIDTLLILLCVVTALTQRWLGLGILTKIGSVLMSIVLIVGSFYITITQNTIDKIDANYFKLSEVGVYVMSDSDVVDIQGLSGAQFGIIEVLERENTDKAIEKIETELGAPISYLEYDGVVNLTEALRTDVVDAIIVNTSYLSMMYDMEEYKELENSMVCIATYSIKTYMEKPQDNNEYLTSDDCVTIYISGIDRYGSPTINSNSDVNIICTINKTTHQVLLLSTPRDFFVPLSISGGNRDKLTHAGAYGVDVSEATLEMLYGINIDYYMKINFSGFENVIDALGGIDVYSEYDFTAYHGGYHYHQGMNRVNGKQALGFARERYSFGAGDRQRGRNQMEVIKGMINKVTSKDMLTNYVGVMGSLSESIVTNMPQEEITAFFKLQLEENPSWEVLTYSVNGTSSLEYTYSLPNKQVYVMVPSEEKIQTAKGYLDMLYRNEYITVTQE